MFLVDIVHRNGASQHYLAHSCNLYFNKLTRYYRLHTSAMTQYQRKVAAT